MKCQYCKTEYDVKAVRGVYGRDFAETGYCCPQCHNKDQGDKIKEPMRRSVIGLIRAMGPTSLAQLNTECQTQVVGYKKITDYYKELNIQEILNEALHNKEIEIDICLKTGEITFDIAHN